MHLVILNVADPFTAVAPDSTDGPGKTVVRLDANLIRAGHESIVMACENSITEGILLATPKPPAALDEVSRHTIHEHYRFILEKFLMKWPIDLIHMHGGDFFEYLPPPGVPVLITLHAPAQNYPETAFQLHRPRTFFHCVSSRQRESFHSCPNLLPEINVAAGDDLLEGYFEIYERLVAEARAADPQPSTATLEFPELAASV